MSLLKRIEGNTAPPDQIAQKGRTVADDATVRLPSFGSGSAPDVMEQLKTRIQDRLVAELGNQTTPSNIGQVRERIQAEFDSIIAEEDIVIARLEKLRLQARIAAEIIGYGPLEPLLQDDTVSEIMVNGANQVYVERRGRLEKTDVRFTSEEHVRRIIDRIISPLGRRCDESSPMVDARLPDGSRVNAIIPPLSLVGPCVTIRKFSRVPLTVEDLVRFGSLTDDVAAFLRACVEARLNVIVAGGTGSGKTTLLNVLSSFIPEDERIITVEDAAELQLRQEHVITLETRKANTEGRGEVTIRELVINCLRMRPDRIVVGECRGDEALDMLVAMNTGHDGSLTTLHANSPRDTLARLQTMVLMAGVDLPLRAVNEQIRSAIQLIIFQERFKDGSRRVSYVTEVRGIEGDSIVLADIFRFVQERIEEGHIIGGLKPTGVVPNCLPRIRAAGLDLSESIFRAATVDQMGSVEPERG
ncbi:MAG: CpaF family protein [Chloroflexota bacterium]|nr:MAG: CpaF family protein [Chloroflexota bacterium]